MKLLLVGRVFSPENVALSKANAAPRMWFCFSLNGFDFGFQ